MVCIYLVKNDGFPESNNQQVWEVEQQDGEGSHNLCTRICLPVQEVNKHGTSKDNQEEVQA